MFVIGAVTSPGGLGYNASKAQNAACCARRFPHCIVATTEIDLPRLTDAQLIKAGELQRDGYTVQNIADYFGVSRITMVKYMKQAEESGLYSIE